jgi:prepilin-type N-terminal cleavage/methylation domain-containing protein
MPVGRPLRALRAREGYTMIELLIVLVILSTVLTALTALFLAGTKAEIESNRRFEAQQDARLAADRMRREVHCAGGVTVGSASSITVQLLGHCPTAVNGQPTDVVYDVGLVSTNRYELRRAGVRVADHLTSNQVFAYTAQSSESRALLSLDLQVNTNPNEGWKTWRLQTDIVLRNTLRQ